MLECKNYEPICYYYDGDQMLSLSPPSIEFFHTYSTQSCTIHLVDLRSDPTQMYHSSLLEEPRHYFSPTGCAELYHPRNRYERLHV